MPGLLGECWGSAQMLMFTQQQALGTKASSPAQQLCFLHKGSNVITSSLKLLLLWAEGKCFCLGIPLHFVACPSDKAQIAELKFGQTKMMWSTPILKLAER